MPVAKPLANHLADLGDFRAVVAAFADLADTLVSLASRPDPVAHRDIKPDNLFWRQGRSVLGDFGIAAWADPEHVTQELDKVGPLAYLAPEALRVTGAPNWHAADVYSLAKSMWSIAAPRRRQQDGTYSNAAVLPPQGPIRATEPANSFKNFGGTAAKELDLLVQEGTSNIPSERPTAAEFAAELRSWLRMHPEPQTARPPASGSRLLGYEDLHLMMLNFNEARNLFLRLLLSELGAMIGTIRSDDSVDVNRSSPYDDPNENGHPKGSAIMSDHGRGPKDEWDGALVLRLLAPSNDLRVIVGGVFRSPTDMDMVSEAHHRDGHGEWKVIQTHDVDNLHPGWPSATEQIRKLLKNLLTRTGIPADHAGYWDCTRVR